jgi:hypothetical protein
MSKLQFQWLLVAAGTYFAAKVITILILVYLKGQ